MAKQQFQTPRGTADILPGEQVRWRYFEARASEAAARFGYERIDTPTFEDARLYVRGVGEFTDVVEKETYTFEDRGGDRITLRPEGTAGVCRAYLQHGMGNLPQPVRLFYFNSLFRYERPQAGRFREHHQLGIEVIGDADAAIDAEVIELAWRLLEDLDIGGLTLLVNSIGDPECRPAYVEMLKDYYSGAVDELCHNCRRRLERNPLRLLDCKEDQCQPSIAGAPAGADHLCGPCLEHWETLLGFLEALGLPFTVEKRLVRGFDYYTRTVFEIVPPATGRMSTICGGGRYDGLIEELGGRPTPGIGFGMGIERILRELRLPEDGLSGSAAPKVVVAHMGEDARSEGMRLAAGLRASGVAALLAPSGRSLRGQLRYAASVNATHAAILGADELARGSVTLRDLSRSDQRDVPMDKLADALTATN